MPVLCTHVRLSTKEDTAAACSRTDPIKRQ
jgi:hypothetical protein